jgi:hypothetical protein
VARFGIILPQCRYCPNDHTQSYICSQLRKMLPEPGLRPTEEPLPQTFSEAQRDEILDSWVTKGVDPLSLSMQCRLKFYSQCIGLESRMQTQPNYFKHLSQQRHFACSSFQQIELDVPRLKNWV